MDGGRHQETSRPQLAEGIRESRTGTMFVFNQLQRFLLRSLFTAVVKSASARTKNT